MNQPATTLAGLQQAAERVEAASTLPWLAPVQAAAAQRLRAQGLPLPRQEAWKYLGLGALVGRNLGTTGAIKTSAVALAGAAIQPGPTDGLARIVFDGHQVLLPAVLPDGLRARRFSDLDASTSAAVHSRIDALVPAQDGFAALNLARCQDGLLLEVAANVTVAAPLALLTRTDDQPAHRRILVLLGENSQLDLVEDCQPGASANDASAGAPGLATQIMECHLGPGARLQHSRLQREGSSASTVDGLHVQLQDDASWQLDQASLGAALRRNDINCHLLGNGASAGVRGLFLLSGQQQLDNHLTLDHQGHHSSSDTLLRGLADGRSKGVVNGRIHIHPGAPGTSADLATNNLLLSPQAEIDCKPELEIYTDDVRCSHGATVGQLDAEALYYLRSRGVPAATARHLLAFGFLAAVLDNHNRPAVAEQLRAVLAKAWAASNQPAVEAA